jgi:signal transduction histidine kinase
LFFEPFYRGEEPGKLREDGKGLGLFISRYIVESHGGILTIRHDDGIFTVSVILPEKI